LQPQHDCFKLNLNGCLNKIGENHIYLRDLEIVKFGIGKIENHVIYLSGGFLSLYPGRGYGRSAIYFLFKKLPCVEALHLKCREAVLDFWLKSGGQVIDKIYDYNIVKIYRINLES
jgi:hypothetical protein